MVQTVSLSRCLSTYVFVVSIRVLVKSFSFFSSRSCIQPNILQNIRSDRTRSITQLFKRHHPRGISSVAVCIEKSIGINPFLFIERGKISNLQENTFFLSLAQLRWFFRLRIHHRPTLRDID